MSAAELEPASARRRIRHDVRDGLAAAAAALSLLGSLVVTALVWAGLRWVA